MTSIQCTLVTSQLRTIRVNTLVKFVNLSWSRLCSIYTIIHTACAPSILHYETKTHSRPHDYPDAIHDFLNMKLRGIQKTHGLIFTRHHVG
ncbi:hypothetical protein LXL04_032649 [Taraxacum kok-saghyz]